MVENTISDTNFLNRGGKKYYSISLIRILSLFLIIICHMFQYFHLELAYWFNVGVQLFLCISGFIYGQRKTPEPVDFYKHRFAKILPSYYIVFCVVGILQFLFASDVFSFLRFGGGLFYRSTLVGGGHLWFVRIILLCYILTPLLGVFRDRYVLSNKSFIGFSFISVVVISLVFGLFSVAINPAAVSCYVIGYSLGINEKVHYIGIKRLLMVFGILAIFSNSVQIYIDYYKEITFAGKMGLIYLCFNRYNHVMLGTFLFLLLKCVFDKIKFTEKGRRLLDLTDDYSYEAYLVHQFLILGPFSLMALTYSLKINVIVILLGITLLAICLKKLTSSICIYSHF